MSAFPYVDRQFAERIAACAGLRNRIVHEYEAIDPARVHEALHLSEHFEL